MRAADVRGLLICGSDYRCSHDQRRQLAGNVRLPDSEPLFTCQASGPKSRRCRREFLLETGGPTRDDVRTTHVGPDQDRWINIPAGMAESNVRKIRGKSSGKPAGPDAWRF